MEWWILQAIISAVVGIGGIIAGILVERRRRKWELEKEAMKEHFEEIKKKCLSCIRERLPELRSYFIYDESYAFPSSMEIEKELKEDA